MQAEANGKKSAYGSKPHKISFDNQSAFGISNNFLGCFFIMSAQAGIQPTRCRYFRIAAPRSPLQRCSQRPMKSADCTLPRAQALWAGGCAFEMKYRIVHLERAQIIGKVSIDFSLPYLYMHVLRQEFDKLRAATMATLKEASDGPRPNGIRKDSQPTT